MKIKVISVHVIILVILQLLVDLLYVLLYPTVNPFRATMIAGTAALVLLVVEKRTKINPGIGGLSIFSSAFFGALLVQAGVLTSKSLLSGVVHVLILIITYITLYYFYTQNESTRSY